MKIQSTNIENPKPFGATWSEFKIWAGNAQNTLWNRPTVGEAPKLLWGNTKEGKREFVRSWVS